MVRLTDRPDMTLDVYRGRKTTTQQQQKLIPLKTEVKLQIADLHILKTYAILPSNVCDTVITLNIGTPRPATVVVFNIKQFNFTLK